MVKKAKLVSRIFKSNSETIMSSSDFGVHPLNLFGLDERWIPLLDITESEKKVKVGIELPGVQENDILISVQSNGMEVKGIKREELVKQEIKFLRLERNYGKFRRFIFFPCKVNPDSAKAILENGVLTIILEKYKHNQSKTKELTLKIRKKKK